MLINQPTQEKCPFFQSSPVTEHYKYTTETGKNFFFRGRLFLLYDSLNGVMVPWRLIAINLLEEWF